MTDRPREEGVGTLLSEVRSEAVRWLWQGRIPLGKITVLDGDPGLGKSLITLDLAARVTSNGDMPDGTKAIEGGVVLASGEDGLSDTVRPRLEAMGANLSRIVDLTITEPEQGKLLRIPDDLSRLQHAITRVNAVLVVIDPIYAFLNPRLDPNKDSEVRQALTPLAKLAERSGVAILIVRHLNKDEKKKVIYRGGGSIALIGVARSGLLVAKSREADCSVLASVKCNLAPQPSSLRYRIHALSGEQPIIKWMGDASETADQLTAPLLAQHASRKLNAVSFLEERLARGPLPSAVLEQSALHAGFAMKTYQRARQQAGIRSYQTREGWISALPTQMVRQSDSQFAPRTKDGDCIVGLA